jgi:hypothetical protein
MDSKSFLTKVLKGNTELENAPVSWPTVFMFDMNQEMNVKIDGECGVSSSVIIVLTVTQENFSYEMSLYTICLFCDEVP